MIWIQSLLAELCVPISPKALIWCDSSAAVVVAGNPVMHSKFKHVELDVFFVREKVAAGILQVGHVPGSYQLADILTKPLSAPMSLRELLNAQLQRLLGIYWRLLMKELETIGEYYAKLCDLSNQAFALREEYSNTKLVRMVLRSLRERFSIKVIVIEEAKDLESLAINEFVGSLQTF
ncbi:uncharacterized protein LOC128036188 [Gossypium raimondii]|uniref:uncharacterized protein LOC128036188 n=1 Tax=Gossypium raimondii TaxID=29730 RepID=UPI00227BA99F|nr:uncharacterized protein LOC128036188 [Gossypium raimondii]